MILRSRPTSLYHAMDVVFVKVAHFSSPEYWTRLLGSMHENRTYLCWLTLFSHPTSTRKLEIMSFTVNHGMSPHTLMLPPSPSSSVRGSPSIPPTATSILGTVGAPSPDIGKSTRNVGSRERSKRAKAARAKRDVRVAERMFAEKQLEKNNAGLDMLERRIEDVIAMYSASMQANASAPPWMKKWAFWSLSMWINVSRSWIEWMSCSLLSVSVDLKISMWDHPCTSDPPVLNANWLFVIFGELEGTCFVPFENVFEK